MWRMLMCLLAAGAAGLGGAAVARADSLEEVQKKIAEALGKHKTMLIKSKTTQDFKSEEFSMKSTDEMATEYKRKGDKGYCSRMETKSNSVRQIKGQDEEKTDSTVLQISDGQYVYVLTRSGNEKMATKQKINRKHDMSPFDAMVMFKFQEKDSTLKLMPDETVDGKAAYVIETTAKEKDKNPQALRILTSYDKKTGIALKCVSYDAKGKCVMTMITTELKVDADIPDDRFVFKAPEGIQVVDLSQASEGQPAETEKPADKAEPAETEKPAAEETKQDVKEEPKEEKKADPVGGLLNRLKKK